MDNLDAESRRTWVMVGVTQGVSNAIKLGYLYMTIPIIGVLLILLLSGNLAGVFGAMFLGIFYLIFGTVLGIFPAAILGAISGGILGAILSLSHIAPHRWNRIAIGTAIAALITAGVHQMALYVVNNYWDGEMGAYYFFIAAPSLFFMVFAVWFSDCLPQLAEEERRKVREYPIRALATTKIPPE